MLPAGILKAQQPVDTFRLFFELDIPTLSPKMEKKIDLLIYNDKIINGSSITIVGYADFLGSNTYNKNLSMKRAENVKDYLVKYGIREDNITLCIGKGEINRKDTTSRYGKAIDRRVDIVVNNKNPLAGKPHGGKRVKRDTAHHTTSVTTVEHINHLRPGTLFKLSNVYFPADRHVMRPESKETLEKLYKVLRDNPRLKISIEGHVCCVRDAPDALDIDTFEPTLSLNRAKAIYTYLVDRGIAADRLSFVGYGRSRPVIYNELSEEDAEKNRRVEIRILEN